jgi:type VI secretion system Hcp family effector
LLLILQAGADAAIYAKYDGVDGESKDANHDKWVDVLSIDWGSHKPGGGATGQSRRRGEVIVEDVTLTIEYEKAAPKLQEACHKGKVFPKLEIDVTSTYDDGARATYLAYELKNVIVTSYSLVILEDGTTALRLSMSFTSLTQIYTDRDGNRTTLEVDRRTGRSSLTEEPGDPTRP